MSIQIADLVASLRAEDAGFTRLMGDAANKVDGLHHSTGSALAGVDALAVGVGALATGAMVSAIKAASDYQTMLVHIQANTGMTDADTRAMSEGIKQMAAQTGAPLDQLAEGFMHIHNFGFDAAQSMQILKPAMESALSTGDNVAEVASTLAVALHEFHLQASQAGVAMNVLHLAAQEGNATLGQFVEGTTKAFNMAGAYRVSLVDVAAALSTLTQSGQTARAASDGISSAFQGIVKPTAASAQFILALSRATGVDLVRDFSAAGLQSRGFANILGDIKLALDKSKGSVDIQRAALQAYSDNLIANHVSQATYEADMRKMALAMRDPAQATNALFSNVRAAREIMLLTGSQADSFTQHLKDMGQAMGGQIDPTIQGFQRQQATLAAQTAKLQETLQVLAINIGTALLPAVTSIAQAVVPVVQAFADWAGKHQELVVRVLAVTAGVGALATVVGGLSTILGPLIALIGALAVPIALVGAAVFALTEAWQHDWFNIREVVAQVWSSVHPVFDALKGALDVLIRAFDQRGLQGVLAALPGAMRPVEVSFLQLALKISNWVNSVDWGAVAAAIGAKVVAWGQAFLSWISPSIAALGPSFSLLASVLGGLIVKEANALPGQLLAWGRAFVDWIRPSLDALGPSFDLLTTVLGDLVVKEAKALPGQLLSWGQAFIAWIKPSVDALGPSLQLLTNALNAWLTQEAKDAGQKALEIGKDLVLGMVHGITDNLGLLKDAAGSMKDSFIGSLKDHLKIFSPSKVTEQMGADTVQGYINGLLAGKDDVTGAGIQIGKSAVQGIQIGFSQALAAVGGTIAAQMGGMFGKAIHQAMRETAPVVEQDWVGVVLPAAEAGILDGEARGAPIQTAIQTVHKRAVAAAMPTVAETHHSLGVAATRAAAQGILAGTSALVSATKSAADKALATFAAMVPSFASVAAEAAGRIKRIMAGEEPIGPTPGTLAPVQETVNQQSIAPTLAAATADAIRQQYQQITTAQQQQQAATQVLGVAQTTQITSVAQLQLLYHKLHLSYLDQERAAQAAGNKDQLDQLKALDQQLNDNYQHALIQLQQYQFQQQQQQAVANAQSRAQAASQASSQAQANAKYTNDVIGQQRLIADTTRQYDAQHKADLAAIAAAQAAHHTAQVAMLKAEAQAHTDAYNQQIAQLRAYLTALQQGHALTMAQIAEEAAARKAALAVQGAAAQAAGAGPTSLAGANVTVASLLAGVSQPSSPLAQAIADMTSQFPKLMQAQGQLVGSLLAAGIAQGLGEQGAITYALNVLSQSMSAQFKQQWGIASPSRVMREYGRNLVDGLVSGIREGQGQARSAFSGLLAGSGGLGLGAPALAGAGGPVSITVNVHGDAVTVQGHDPQQIGRQLGDFAKRLVQAARTTGPGNRRLQPGVPNVIPGGGS